VVLTENDFLNALIAVRGSKLEISFWDFSENDFVNALFPDTGRKLEISF